MILGEYELSRLSVPVYTYITYPAIILHRAYQIYYAFGSHPWSSSAGGWSRSGLVSCPCSSHGAQVQSGAQSGPPSVQGAQRGWHSSDGPQGVLEWVASMTNVMVAPLFVTVTVGLLSFIMTISCPMIHDSAINCLTC